MKQPVLAATLAGAAFGFGSESNAQPAEARWVEVNRNDEIVQIDPRSVTRLSDTVPVGQRNRDSFGETVFERVCG